MSRRQILDALFKKEGYCDVEILKSDVDDSHVRRPIPPGVETIEELTEGTSAKEVGDIAQAKQRREKRGVVYESHCWREGDRFFLKTVCGKYQRLN